MRYLIIRRRIRKALLFLLLVTVVVSMVPWLYEKLFVSDEDFVAKDFSLAQYESFIWDTAEVSEDISLDLSILNNDYVFSKINLREAELKGIKVSGDIFTKGRIIKDRDARPVGFEAKLFSDNITLDSKPFLPLKASFKILDGKLEIEEAYLTKPYRFKGTLALTAPYNVNGQFDIDRADMRGLSKTSRVKGSNIVFGMVSGSFYIKGALLGNIFSEGVIESRRGRLGSIEYELVTVKIEGFGPIINIVDSSFKYDGGILTMEGYVDLRDIAKGSMFDGVTIRSDVKTIVWRGWDITKKGTDELHMKKAISDNMRVGFKTIARDPLPTYYDGENPEEMSLEYKIGSENIQMKLKDNEEFLGVEHSVSF